MSRESLPEKNEGQNLTEKVQEMLTVLEASPAVQTAKMFSNLSAKQKSENPSLGNWDKLVDAVKNHPDIRLYRELLKFTGTNED